VTGVFIYLHLIVTASLISVSYTFIESLHFKSIIADQVSKLLIKPRAGGKSRLFVKTYLIPSPSRKNVVKRKKSKKSPQAIAVFKIFVL
tara:strand:+ start:1387 stop:1653 length:267 start_codon:yes stop_codon:yes gene_type:complete